MRIRLPWMTRTDRALWRSARTIADLAGRTALWLEGEIGSHPGCATPNCGPDKETKHLVPVLAAANRAGFLTDNSQPGLVGRGRDGNLWEQRAWVTGWVDRDDDQQLVCRLTAAALTAGLLVCVDQPGTQFLVTKVAGRQHTMAGTPLPAYLRVQWPAHLIDRSLFTALENASTITLVDPRYGRDNVLWPVLANALPQPRTRS